MSRATIADPLDGLVGHEEIVDRQATSDRHPKRRRRSSRSNAWLYAALASIFWLMAVAAFCWARYGLPFSLDAARAVASRQISMSDWMLIAAAIIVPLLLIWGIALLLRRSSEMRSESRQLANAAARLARAAETPSAALGVPAINAEMDGAVPRHFRREVERATHAISALHNQMNAIEQALSTQAASIDDVAERAERRAKSIATTLRNETHELERVASRLDQVNTVPQSRVAAAGGLAAAAAGIGGGIAMASASSQASDADVVDLTLVAEPELDGEPEGIITSDDGLVDPFDNVGAVGLDRSEPKVSAPAQPGAEKTERPGKDALRAAVQNAQRDDGRPNFAPGRRGEANWSKFVRAANFPDNEEDTETLDALYEVLTDPEIASLLQSAEDTLAALADIDLYMEDYAPTLAPADDWHRYLVHLGRIGGGVAGRGIFTMSGVTAELEEQRIASKRSNVSSFKSLTDRFLDRYEEILVRMINSGAPNNFMVELGNTRTGRAYTLVAQAAQRLRHLSPKG